MKRWRVVVVVVFVVAFFVGGGGCASARRGEPVGSSFTPTTAEGARGQQVFMVHCNQCHPGGGAGLGPALNNKPLPRAAIKAQVRWGVGAMPGFSDARITDDELEALVSWMETVHHAPSDPG